MIEILVNLHMHTRYSDGSGSHEDLARAAVRQGVDAILVTDHNIRVAAMERYYVENNRRVLILVGEELHNRSALPQKNHLLVFGAGRELAPFAEDLQSLLHAARLAGGLCFVAHPVDPPATAFHEPDISWEANFTQEIAGLELWNGFSELKAHLPTRLHGLFYAFFPRLMAQGPLPTALQLWDRLLRERSVVAIGGSDAHALNMRAGPVRRTVFPYDYHFRAVNTHVLVDESLSGVASQDAKAIYAALASGRCFIGYDLPAPTRGFRFVAHAAGVDAPMGSTVDVAGGATLHVWTPQNCELLLLRNGRPVGSTRHSQALTHRVVEPGTYRVEAYRRYAGRRRAWIISNPIYVS
ncbi:MAG TPA: CehA/McbA family metallohydrolase [Anaerolineales bacterium]|nr:CehA/McbA family metallohydrolase [Anaerolineales bacterium]